MPPRPRPRRARPTGVLLLGVALGGCDALGAEAAAVTTPPASSTALTRPAPWQRMRAELAALGGELQRERPAAKRGVSQACPDERLRQLDADPTLVVLPRDHRYDQRQLIPLTVLQLAAPDELLPLRSILGVDASFSVDGSGNAPSAEALAQVADRLGALRSRRFVAELRITSYAPPRVTRKAGAVRSEWVAGVLGADLVVFDRAQEQALCQSPLLVRNRVAEAPLTRRLRADTRDRLLVELAEALRDAAATSLPSLSGYLRWPPLTGVVTAGDDRGRSRLDVVRPEPHPRSG